MKAKPGKILIVRLSALGDVVDVLPALRSLRSHFPNSEIAWLVEDRACNILSGHPDIDKIIVFPRKRWQRNILHLHTFFETVSDMVSFYRNLRNERYDFVLDFHGNLKSGIMTILTGAENRIGFGKGHCKEFNYLFTKYHITPPRKRIHRIERNLTLLSSLNIDTGFLKPELPISIQCHEYVSAFLETKQVSSKPIILVHPCTSAYGAYKRWSTSNYALLADMILTNFDAHVIFTWGPNELDIIDEIVGKMKNTAIVACETTIKQLVELIRQADLFIGGDTGPLHIASTLCIPTVAIFGPKDPAIYGPYNGNSIIVSKELPCSPCRQRTCSDTKCITTILPEEVFDSVSKLMTGSVLKKVTVKTHI
ncbi:MAG: glycosyltransferase family 9 protein [Candidatus Scalindua sp.]|nr:glycosyltransferase family 9 protein [Candidatus Scalindua sp.]